MAKKSKAGWYYVMDFRESIWTPELISITWHDSEPLTGHARSGPFDTVALAKKDALHFFKCLMNEFREARNNIRKIKGVRHVKS